MANYVYFINDFYKQNAVNIALSNRSFRYGDGIFETIRVFEGKIPFLSFHFARLQKALSVLDLELDKTLDKLEGLLLETLKKNNLKNARLRLMVFRSGAGLYKAETSKASILIEVKALAANQFMLNEKGLTLGIFTDVPKVFSTISMLKTNNALPYILAANFAQKNEFDECILVNEKGNLADCIYSNIFMIKDKYIFTPPISDGAVAGTMQAVIMQVAQQQGWELHQVSLTAKDLLASDEVFLTNAIRGVQWVGKFEDKTFTNNFCGQIVQILNKQILSIKA